MYSKAGPVMVEPSGLCAIGSVMVVLKFAVLVPAALSHPLQTMVNPRGIRNEFASTAVLVIEPGSFPPPVTRPSDVQVFPPRLGGLYITLCAPRVRSIG